MALSFDDLIKKGQSTSTGNTKSTTNTTKTTAAQSTALPAVTKSTNAVKTNTGGIDFNDLLDAGAQTEKQTTQETDISLPSVDLSLPAVEAVKANTFGKYGLGFGSGVVTQAEIGDATIREKEIEEEMKTLNSGSYQNNKLKRWRDAEKRLALEKEQEELQSRKKALEQRQAQTTAENYASIPLRADFLTYSGIGAGMDDDYKSAPEGAVSGYEFMTDIEKSVYNYLLAKDGSQAAANYRDRLQNSIGPRLGRIYSERVSGIENPAGRALAAGAYGFGAGVEQALGGLIQATTDKQLPVSGVQYGSQMIREGLKDSGPKILGSSLGQIGYDIVNTVGGMTPSILVSAMTAGMGAPAAAAAAAGSGTLGLAAGGNAYNQALQEGYSEDEARAYGYAIGVSEGALQYALGGIGKLSGGVNSKVASKIAGVENGIKKFIAKHGSAIIEEAGEEALQSVLEPVFRTAAFGEDLDIDMSEVAYSALLGGFTGGVLGGGTHSDLSLPAVPETPTAQKNAPTGDLSLPKVNEDVNAVDLNLPGVNVATQVEAETKARLKGGESAALVDKVRKSIPQINGMAPVTEVTGSELPQSGKITDRLMSFISGIGNKVTRAGFGDVLFTKSKIKNSMLGHGVGNAKIETFAAVPAVIENGIQIDYQKEWKGRPYDTYVFAAPIIYRGNTTYLGAIVQKDSVSNRYYLHEVVDENGNVIFKNTEAPADASDGTSALSGDLDTVASAGASVESISQTGADYNGQIQQSEETPLSWASRENLRDGFQDRASANEVYNGSIAQTGDESNRQSTLEGMKRGVDELMNSWVEYATRKDPVSLSPEEREATAASKIMTDYKASGDSLGEAGRKAWSFIKRKMIDSGEAVQRVAKATGDRYLYPYYNMARASSNAAVSMIVDAQTDVTGRKTGESLNSIFQPIMDKGVEYYNAFQSFLYHRHNVDRRSRDRSAETEEARREWLNYRQSHPELQYYSDQQLASMAVNENSTMYDEAREYLKLLRKYNHTMKAVDKPVFGYEVSAEDSRAIAERLQREHPEFVQEAEKVYKYIDGLLKYRVDSGLITEESYEQLKKLYPHYVPTYRAGQESQYDTSRENTVEIGKTIKRAEGGESKLMPIHTALARQTYNVVREGSKNRFGQRLMEQQTSGTSASKLIGRIEQYEGSFSSDDFDTLDDSAFKKENVFIVHEGGKRYEIEVSPELFEGVKALSPDKEETNLLVRMAAAGNNAYKQLITGLNPTFMVRNFVRDLQDAGLYTKNLAGFAANYPQALAQIASNGEYWQQYKALGGMYSSVFDYQTGTVKKESGLKKNTLGKIEALNMAVEQAPRLAEFMATVKKGDGSVDNLMEAMYNAADVTTNFGRSGTWGKWLNRYLIPFFNPAIQGTDKFIRNFTEAKGAKQWAGLITKSAALGIAPTILNNLLYDDDEEWEDIRQSDKDTNYLFKIKDGLWLKIPKGRALSMFGMTADRVTQARKGEEVDYAEFINTAASQMAPTNPLKENVMTDWFNTKLFDPDDPGETWYGSDIENQRMQGYEPSQRYDSKTDEISKWIGEKTGLSPKKINYLLQQYTGVIGDVVLPLLTPSAERDMFSAAFTIDTNYSNELGTRFYSTLDDLEFAKNAEDANPADVAVYRYWNKVSGNVSDINAAIRAVEASEELSGEEKKSQTAEQYAIRNAIEKSALETLASYEEAAHRYFSEYDGPEENAADYAYLMANREVFGAEYAIQTYNKTVYEKAKALAEQGVSYDTFFDYYFTVKDFVSEKDAKGNTIVSESSLKREFLASMNISDNEKHAIYTAYISDAHEDDIELITATGLDFDAYLEIQNKYTEINNMDAKASQKALALERWIEQSGFTAAQESAIEEAFSYYSMVPATAGKYDALTGAGFDDETAAEIIDIADDYDAGVTAEKLEMYRAIVNSVEGSEEQLRALSVYMDDNTLNKCAFCYEEFDLMPGVYVTVRQEIYKADADSQKEVRATLDLILGLSNEQKAALWQLQNKSWKPKNNPYDTQIGAAVYEMLNR